MSRFNLDDLRLDPLLRRVWRSLGRPAGCRVVGGYVRDRLLGRDTHDLDLALDGTADDAASPVRRLAADLGARAHLLGTLPHRVWRIEGPDLQVELWSLDTLSPAEDLLRRDFTCNALGWELPDGPLVDLTGGLEDLRARRLRAISRANLVDDPVRLLRAPRFLAQLPDFELGEPTLSWLRELGPRLGTAPRERVGQELLAIVRGPAASRGIAVALELGLFGYAAPDLHRVDRRWLEDHLGALDILNARKTPPGTPAGQTADTARLALLTRSWGVVDDDLLAPYAWPRPLRRRAVRAAALLEEARDAVNLPAADRRELAWRAGAAFPALLVLAAASDPRRRGWQRWQRQWRRSPESLLHPRPVLSGDEIAELTGAPSGPELGAVIDAFLRAQVRGAFRSRQGARTWLRRQTG